MGFETGEELPIHLADVHHEASLSEGVGERGQVRLRPHFEVNGDEARSLALAHPSDPPNDLTFSSERPPERSEEGRSSAATSCWAARIATTAAHRAHAHPF